MSSYENIFSATNCSLISGVIPPGIKKFVNGFMDGNLLRNPLTQVFSLVGDQVGTLLGRLEVLDDIAGLQTDLQKLNTNLKELDQKLQDFKRHTNILSGVVRDPQQAYATVDQIIGVMSAYNSMKDVLKDPGAKLEDNFSNAFRSINPRIVGPFFENFSDNMNEIESLLDEITYQVDAAGITSLSAPVGALSELGNLAGNLGQLSNTMQGFINKDKATYIAAAAALADYALANGLVASVLSDPCFGGQVVMNLISNPQGRNDLMSIAKENGINIQNEAVDFSGLISGIQMDRQPLGELTPIITPPANAADGSIIP